MLNIYIYIYIGSTVLKNLPASARDEGDLGSISGSGRSPGGGNGNLLQYSCLENSMDRGGWQATSPWSYKELNTTEHSYTHAHTYTHTPYVMVLTVIPLLGIYPKELKIGTQSNIYVYMFTSQ